jgi:hypothetical protein
MTVERRAEMNQDQADQPRIGRPACYLDATCPPWLEVILPAKPASKLSNLPSTVLEAYKYLPDTEN